jgi:2-polyprenyl-6-methoxyphenol hydroxylase-like FAD-dependent oxidoreductase
MSQTEVLIVGAGPVGLLSALALAQRGVRVSVIEAEGQLNDSPRAIAYFAASLLALKDMGLLDEFDRMGARIHRFGIHVPEFNFHEVISAELMQDVTFGYWLNAGQDALGELARTHCEKLGVKILFDHRLTGLEQTDREVIARISTPAGDTSLTADWVIGADGARSTVRKLCGLKFEGHTWPNRFIATNIYCDFAALGYEKANFICDPVYSGMIAVINAEGLWRLTYQEDGELPVETFMERLPERYAHFIPATSRYELKMANPYTLHQRCAERLREGRVFLAGDAAHATNPMGGLGLTTGLWTGLILTDLLSSVINRTADIAVLDRFSDERRRVFWEVTSPGATENKRLLEEKNLETRLKDMESVKQTASDPKHAREMLAFHFKVVGDTLHEKSRWRHIDPISAAEIDVKDRRRWI